MAGHRPEDARSGRTAWVVGSSGMLGSAVVRRLRVLGRDVVTTRVPWHDHDAAVEALLAAARDLPDEGWELFWCAGAAVTASSQADVDAEVAVFEGLLSEWQPSTMERAGIFLASSAGGLYAGATRCPVHRAHRAGADLGVRPGEAEDGGPGHRVRPASRRRCAGGPAGQPLRPGTGPDQAAGVGLPAVPGRADQASADGLRLDGHSARLPLRRRRGGHGRRRHGAGDRPRRPGAQGARERALDDGGRDRLRPAAHHQASAARRVRHQPDCAPPGDRPATALGRLAARVRSGAHSAGSRHGGHPRLPARPRRPALPR